MTPFYLAVLSILIGPFPIFIALLATLIAKICGCTLNEGSAEKCIVLGVDISGFLYGMFMFAWLAMFTMGLMFIGLMTSAVWALMS